MKKVNLKFLEERAMQKKKMESCRINIKANSPPEEIVLALLQIMKGNINKRYSARQINYIATLMLKIGWFRAVICTMFKPHSSEEAKKIIINELGVEEKDFAHWYRAFQLLKEQNVYVGYSPDEMGFIIRRLGGL